MDDAFGKLREQLALQEWPNVYLFKFIAPNDSKIVAQLTSLFDDAADLNYQPSRNGKYMSVSGKELMMDVDSIISKYVAVSQIKGVIAL